MLSSMSMASFGMRCTYDWTNFVASMLVTISDMVSRLKWICIKSARYFRTMRWPSFLRSGRQSVQIESRVSPKLKPSYAMASTDSSVHTFSTLISRRVTIRI